MLAYLCVDFGFFHKLFQMKPEANAVYRAAAESALAASLVVFLHVFLRLALWHGLIRMLITVWLLAQFSLIAVAIVDPRLAATFARLSFVFIGVTGAGLILYLAFRGQDRALSLIPTWILFLVWIFGAGVTLTGRLSGDIVVSGLVAGLVLILLLIGFTVTQYAFRSVEPMYSGRAVRAAAQVGCGRRGRCGGVGVECAARQRQVSVRSSRDGSACTRAISRHASTSSCVISIRRTANGSGWPFRPCRSGATARSTAISACARRDNSYRWFELEAARRAGHRSALVQVRRPDARRDGYEARARASAARCRARQPDGPAEPGAACSTGSRWR